MSRVRLGISLGRACFAMAVALVLVTEPGRAAAGSRPLYEDPRAPLEERVADALARLTPAERVALLAGGSAFGTQPIARLGIPALHFSDGPNGVRSNEDRTATAFPTGSALAATWNPEVLEEVGEAIGREALALDVQVMLGPDVNIQRSPLAGRNFEDYSEDPFLAGTLGAAFVRGVQSQGVGTSVKHFVGNEQELERGRSSSNIDERTLREIYLRPFEMIVERAHPWTVMVSYNRLNGIYMSENRRLVHDVLQGEWGFDGVVMSDWGAVHSTVDAARSGLDLEMPGPPRYFGDRLDEAVHNWQVDASLVDEAARRMLRLIIRSGALDGKPHAAGELESTRNRAAALHAASEAIVLLRNERGLLPLDRARLRSLAIVGPDADTPLYGGGGSSRVISSRIETPLERLRQLAGSGVRILYARGCDNDAVPPPADARLLSPTSSRSQRGLAFSYYAGGAFAGPPVRTGIETYFDKTLIAAQVRELAARWQGYLWAPQNGTYELSLSGVGDAQLYIDGRELIGGSRGRALPAQLDFGAPVHLASVALEGGKRYRIRIDYESAGAFHSLHFGLRLPTPSIERAVQAAREADAAIVFVGSSRDSETEGRDRQDMQLPGRQNELVEAVLAANPNTIVVLESGAPYALPWASKVPALLEGWLDGEEGPQALARVLFGVINPSGKLPVTFPRRLEDNPAYFYYSAGRDANYGEGVFVGYRYYDKRDIEPLFPFGYGLSYTTFEFRNLRVPATVAVGQSVPVSVEVTNSGHRAGAQTVQLYLGDEATTEVVRPVKELEAFRKVTLAPGETQTVTFMLAPRALAYYDSHRHDWVSTPGTHRILIGSSSRDIRLERDFEWAAVTGSR